jgi:hypothetical protein
LAKETSQTRAKRSYKEQQQRLTKNRINLACPDLILFIGGG